MQQTLGTPEFKTRGLVTAEKPYMFQNMQQWVLCARFGPDSCALGLWEEVALPGSSGEFSPTPIVQLC